MIKKERRRNEDKYFRLESKREKTYGKKKKPKHNKVDEQIAPDIKMSATELAEYYEDLE
jgi:hypothetical protein